MDRDLPNDFLKRSAAEKWGEVLGRLEAGEMPPKVQPRPSATEVAKVVEWISRERSRAEAARPKAGVVLRRLNRAEYNNTIRELTGVEMNPADEFPADPPAGGFDNNGEALTISPLHLELYAKAARSVLDQAIVMEAERPRGIKWRFELEQGSKDGQLDRYRKQVDGQSIFVNAGNNPIRNGMVVLRRQQWDSFAQVWRFTVPKAGYYTIRLRACGKVPKHEEVRTAALAMHERAQQKLEEKLIDEKQRRQRRQGYEQYDRPGQIKHFTEDSRYRYGPPRIKLLGDLGSSRLLGEFDVPSPEDKPEVYELKVWFDATESNVFIRNVYHIPQHSWNWWVQKEDEFPRPELLIDWVELEGPIYDDWPPGSHRRVLGDTPTQVGDEVRARLVLRNFMRRAYRRPVAENEVESKLALFRKVRPDRDSFEEAIKTPLAAVLTSPHLLYLVEAMPSGVAAEGTRRLNDFELASRLSYFLWSSMPDEELFRLAEQRKLGDVRTLLAQVRCMLADTKSEQFVRNFAGQWLRLRDVGANPPSPQIFPEYDDHLEVSMRGESEAFFAHILRNDLSVLNLIWSDFVTINERLARFYDIRGVKGDHFRAVAVPGGVTRGGVMTQASVLSVTSNGTRTSPVWRGVFVLERLLDDPPPPPPPNVGDIPPATPGGNAATLRDRLAMHREQAQCARCHEKIDPLGLALENFDAAGQWRVREPLGATSEAGPNAPTVDARARLPDGTEFVGVEGLQTELLKRQDRFLGCLAKWVYGYALGREIGAGDRAMIEGAVAHMKRNGLTLRSLIEHIVSSDAFRSK